MIEAVNSVISNTSVLRGQSEQVGAARSFVVAPDKVREAPSAPFLRLHVDFDDDFKRPVLEIRDSGTGDVLDQFPTKETLASRERVEVSAKRSSEIRTNAAQEATPTTAVSVAPETQEAPSAPTPDVAQAAAKALSNASKTTANSGNAVSITA
jgi:hypothetical protein